MISSIILITIHKISYYKVRVSTGSLETRWLGDSFLMVYRNITGRLGSGFISVCLENRWLGQKSGFYVPERPCIPNSFFCFTAISLTVFNLHVPVFCSYLLLLFYFPSTRVYTNLHIRRKWEVQMQM